MNDFTNNSLKVAKKFMDDWAAETAATGLSGNARIVGQTESVVGNDLNIPVGSQEEPENQTKIPIELIPYIKEILSERDKLLKARDDVHEHIPTANDKAAATLAAINIIRERRKDELHGETTAG